MFWCPKSRMLQETDEMLEQDEFAGLAAAATVAAAGRSALRLIGLEDYGLLSVGSDQEADDVAACCHESYRAWVDLSRIMDAAIEELHDLWDHPGLNMDGHFSHLRK